MRVITMDPAEAKKVSELVEELVLVCKDSSQSAALFHENLQELWPTLQGASSHTLPKVLLHNSFFIRQIKGSVTPKYAYSQWCEKRS